MVTIPRFIVCSTIRNAPDGVASFPAIPFQDRDGNSRRGVLMFTSEKTARSFIANEPRGWRVRCLDFSLVRDFLTSHMSRRWFNCVVVDFRNDGQPQSATILELDAAVKAIDEWSEGFLIAPRAETSVSEF